MKNRQFIVLCCLIVIQPLVCYIMFWYYSHYIDRKVLSIESNTEWLTNSLEGIEYQLDKFCPTHWPVND